MHRTDDIAHLEIDTEAKQKERKEVKSAVEEYLKKGGKIKKLDDISGEPVKRIGPNSREDHGKHWGSNSPKYYGYETNYKED